MGFLSFGNKKSAPTIKEFRGKLPSIHSFVEVAVRNGPNGSVCFEKTGPTTFVTSALPGMSPGQRASFNYQNTDGKYRFSAAVKAVDARQATFDLPLKIETVQKFGGSQKRTTVRIDTTVAMQWRYSSAGRIQTEWHKGVLSDISRTGSSLASDREIKIGTVIELRIPLLPDGGPCVISAAARRIDEIKGSSKYSIGLSFEALTSEADRTIFEFINRRQAALRARGLA
jgi:c-di-GMP-binding flagellar brake protein YcgR